MTAVSVSVGSACRCNTAASGWLDHGVGRTYLDDWLRFVTFQEDFGAALFKRSVGSFENLDQLHAGMAIGDRPRAGVDAVQEMLALDLERLLLFHIRDVN